MRPSAAFFDSPNGGETNAKKSSNRSHRLPIGDELLYFCDCLIGQLVIRVIFASRALRFSISQRVRVQHVLTGCYVLKVLVGVVCFVLINVIDLMTWRALSKEVHGYKFVNFDALGSAVRRQENIKVAIAIVMWLKQSADISRFGGFCPPHIAMTGNFVMIFKANNRLPNFFHAQPPLIEMLREWLRSNRRGRRLSGATLAAQGAF